MRGHTYSQAAGPTAYHRQWDYYHAQTELKGKCRTFVTQRVCARVQSAALVSSRFIAPSFHETDVLPE
jgi:hypothetical protein